MKVLGVVLAGGQSRRFGSDKALAELGGRTLLDRAVATLSQQCLAVAVAGRGADQDASPPTRPPTRADMDRLQSSPPAEAAGLVGDGQGPCDTHHRGVGIPSREGTGWTGPLAIADRPRAAMGPLGGLNGALHCAAERGFDAVLSIPVDGFDLPVDLIAELSPAPAFAVDAPVIGLWPTSARQALEAFLAEDRNHSMRAFAARIGARAVTLSRQPANINTPADMLAAKEHAHGL